VNALGEPQFFFLGQKSKSNNSRIAIILQSYGSHHCMNRLPIALTAFAGRFGS